MYFLPRILKPHIWLHVSVSLDVDFQLHDVTFIVAQLVTKQAPNACAQLNTKWNEDRKEELCKLTCITKLHTSGVASPKIWGGQKIWGVKMFDFRRIILFCLEKRLSKHKMTIFQKFGGYGPPGYAYVANAKKAQYTSQMLLITSSIDLFTFFEVFSRLWNLRSML